MKLINPYQAKYFAYELSKKVSGDNPEKFGATLMDAKVELNPHQVEAALFAFKSPYSKGAILADEVGLGKTIEAGLIISQSWAERKRKILIICPSSLRKQWVNELEDKFYLKSEVLETPSFNRKQREGIRNPFDSGDTIKVCSYQFARLKAEEVQLTSWDLVVIDEAHYLRNVYRPSNVTANSLKIALRDYKKVLLTATPLQNRLEELYGLVSFIDEDLFGDIKTFKRNYVLESGTQDISGLKERTKDIIHRTLRKDVREFVPFRERIPITVKFQPSEAEQILYDEVLEYLRRDDSYAFPASQKHLMQSVIFKLLGSSSFAIGRTIEALIRRLRKMLDNSKVIDDEIYNMFAEEYESYGSEHDEREEEDGEAEIEITLDDKINIEEEVEQLERFLLLANSIEHNEKGEKLLIALEQGFDKLEELGASRKALIFTESTRTQQYLFERLSREYPLKVLLFNGSNNDDISRDIYNRWKEDDANLGKITGSRSVDIRHALVDAFKSDDYDIMVATEAAAEGINLQFCSMIVNYDLPWNPQRIEQRIGRCHRYGQKFDVVVVNFLNAANEVESRVFELLQSKFKLFEGVFGSSDEVLGAIESGVDFEKKIIEIYKQCRTKEDIDLYFDELNKEFEEYRNEAIQNIQNVLFENFQAAVINRLRVTLSETKVFLERYEKWLWELTKYYLKHRAKFIYDDYTFILDNGNRYTLNKKREDAKPFLLNGEVAQSIIGYGKKEDTPYAKLSFDFSASGLQHTDIEALKSKLGWIKIGNLEVKSEIESHSVLLFAGVTTHGERLDDEMCRFILNLPSIVEIDKAEESDILQELYLEKKKDREQYLELTDAALLQREFRKFNNWADDKIRSLGAELEDARIKEREIAREASAEGLTASEVLQKQEELSKAKKKVGKLRRKLFEREDEIEAERDQMIEDARLKLDRSTTEEEIFTIAFEII